MENILGFSFIQQSFITNLFISANNRPLFQKFPLFPNSLTNKHYTKTFHLGHRLMLFTMNICPIWRLIWIILFSKLSEIVGTKEYRQPEWVTQMEEMREALRGNMIYFIHNHQVCLELVFNIRNVLFLNFTQIHWMSYLLLVINLFI